MNSRSRQIMQMALAKDQITRKSTTDKVCDEENCKKNSSFEKTHEWIINSNFHKWPLSGDENTACFMSRNELTKDDQKCITEKSKIYTKLCPLYANTKRTYELNAEGFDTCACTHILDSDCNSEIIYQENIKLYINKPQTTVNMYGANSKLPSLNESAEHKGKANYNYEFDTESIDDDERDKDFNINDYLDGTDATSDDNSNDLEVDNDEIQNLNSALTLMQPPDDNSNDVEAVDGETINFDTGLTLVQPLSVNLKEKKSRSKKVIRCRFCDQDIDTKNFTRHIQRNHGSEKEIKNILNYPKNSKERRNAFSLLRNNTNFDLFINGITRPNRQIINDADDKAVYYPCAYCKGLFMKKYLKRHSKACLVQTSKGYKKEGKRNYLSSSQTMTACAMDITNVVSKLNVKQQVFDLMKGDEIAFEAKKDLLIAHFGESYLKKHRRERMAYTCSNRMRELSRLLINYRKIINNSNVPLKDLLLPKHFDNVVSAARNISGYDPLKKTFASPSLAMHLGTSLKFACEELINLILKESKGFKCESTADSKLWLSNLKNFIRLIQSRWNIELASLANKDLQEKKWNKPLLLPLVSDIKKFRDESLKIGSECIKTFLDSNDDQGTYKLLSQCTLALLILFNRRRIGDVQFLKVKDYNNDRKSNFTDFQNALTETEKVLTTKYKRVVNSGKGSRAVVILVPQILQKFINVLLKHREKYLSSENQYVFALPGSSIKWGKGDVAFRALTKKIKLQHPEAMSSNKLRKHIATVMQILNLTKEEMKQFSNFMGHTEQTHEEFYELPVDIYQTAKVSKILLMMEKGSIPLEYKGKSLTEIDIDLNLEHVEENEIENEGIILLDSNDTTTPVIVDNNDNNSNKSNSFQKADEQEKDSYAEKMDICENTEEEISIFNLEIDETDEVPNKKIKKTIQKKSWTNQEISMLEDEFQAFIKNKTYPSGNEIKQFIKKTKMNRTVLVIKSKIQHIIKLKNKRVN